MALKVKQRRRRSIRCRLSECFDVSTHLSRGDLQTAVLWEPARVEKRFSPVVRADVELRISNRTWWSQHLGLWSGSEVRHPFSRSDYQANPLGGCILSCRERQLQNCSVGPLNPDPSNASLQFCKIRLRRFGVKHIRHIYIYSRSS